ncbi:MAG: hypothetical protein C4527_24905 [Candidatus Omnitrophota bacterium]|nr:MAG: hypothetical protein C4527_24905 [Candidatus Omnitrophota bacterium]
MARTVDNNGIGALYATFEIDQTGAAYDLTIDNVGDAVSLSGNNEVDHGSDGGQLVGRLEHVCGGLATVQIAGVARFSVNTTKTAPAVGNGVVVDGAGKVYRAPAVDGAAGDPAGGNIARGSTLAVDNANHTCDVLLG